MSSIAPRRACPICHRSIAVIAGRFARHDPTNRGPILLSCHGSLRPAPVLDEPARDGTISLFELLPLDAMAPEAQPAGSTVKLEERDVVELRVPRT